MGHQGAAHRQLLMHMQGQGAAGEARLQPKQQDAWLLVHMPSKVAVVAHAMPRCSWLGQLARQGAVYSMN